MLEVLMALCFGGALYLFLESTDIDQYAKNKKKSNLKAKISVLLLILGICFAVLILVN